jgi:hypothetical protein
MQELSAAVRGGVNVVVVRKDGALWPDVHGGNHVCEHPQPWLINQQEECVREKLCKSKMVLHSDEYYGVFCEALVSRIRTRTAAVGALRSVSPPLPAAASPPPPEVKPAAPSALRSVVSSMYALLWGPQTEKDVPSSDLPRFRVYLSHVRADAHEAALGVYNMLVKRGISTFSDFNCDETLQDALAIVQACDNLVFILSGVCIVIFESGFRHALKLTMLLPARACYAHAYR